MKYNYIIMVYSIQFIFVHLIQKGVVTHRIQNMSIPFNSINEYYNTLH